MADLEENVEVIAQVFAIQPVDDLISHAKLLIERPASNSAIIALATIRYKIFGSETIQSRAKEIVSNARSISELSCDELLLLIGSLAICEDKKRAELFAADNTIQK